VISGTGSGGVLGSFASHLLPVESEERFGRMPADGSAQAASSQSKILRKSILKRNAYNLVDVAPGVLNARAELARPVNAWEERGRADIRASFMLFRHPRYDMFPGLWTSGASEAPEAVILSSRPLGIASGTCG
jgi:hypothetical protein